MSEPITYYDLLGVSPRATRSEIKDAYHGAMKHYHPDVNAAPNATSIARLVNDAWTTLGEPAARSRYDASLARPQPVTEAARPPGGRRGTMIDAVGRLPLWAWAGLAAVGLVLWWKYVLATVVLALMAYRTFRYERRR